VRLPDFHETLSKRVLLVGGATRVRRLDSVSAATNRDVFVKQDDQTSALYGGTKTRKLEFILQAATAAGADSLVTLGSWGSHHIIATALHARTLGLRVHAIVSPQPRTLYVEYALHRCMQADVALYPAGSGLNSAYVLWKVLRELRRKGRRPYLINLGGSSGAGMLGTVRAALELTQQISEGSAPSTGPIYVALGSGSTVAGLALGLVLSGQQRRIRAIQVTSGMVVNRFVLHRLLVAGADLLVEPRARQAVVKAASECIDIDRSMLGRGYGWPCSESDSAIALAGIDGLALEATYTAKVLSALLARPLERGPALYWHTLSTPQPPPSGELMLPPWYDAQFQG
jgi:D-cysteine desulfhydrase